MNHVDIHFIKFLDFVDFRTNWVISSAPDAMPMPRDNQIVGWVWPLTKKISLVGLGNYGQFFFHKARFFVQK